MLAGMTHRTSVEIRQQLGHAVIDADGCPRNPSWRVTAPLRGGSRRGLIASRELSDETPWRARLAGNSSPTGEPRRTQSVFLNQLKSLPVRFTPEAA